MKTEIKHSKFYLVKQIIKMVFPICILLSQQSPLSGQIDWPEEVHLVSKTILDTSILLKSPVGMVYDDKLDILFIADPEAHAVFAYHKDSEELKIVMQNRDVEPEYIAIDPMFEIIYWTDKKYKSIHRMSYQGRNPMNIYSRKRTQPTYLSFDQKNRKLIWVDARNKSINTIDPLGSISREIYWAKGQIIKGLDVDKNGLIYYASQSQENAKMPFRTVYSLNNQSGKCLPIWRNSAVEISSFDYNAKGESLICTEMNNQSFRIYSLKDYSICDTVALDRVVSNIHFVGSKQFYWVESNNSKVYFTDLEQFEMQKRERKEKIDEIIASNKRELEEKKAKLKNQKDVVSISQEEQKLKNITTHTSDPNLDSTNIENAYASIVKINKIHKINYKIGAQSKTYSAYLLDIDEDKMHIIHLEYFGPYNFPQNIQLDQVQSIATRSIRKIEIENEIVFSNVKKLNNQYISQLIKMEKKKRFRKTYILWGGGGFALDVAGGFSSFPGFTITGAIIGLVAGGIKSLTVKDHIVYKDDSFNKYHVVTFEKKKVSYDLTGQSWGNTIKALKQFSYIHYQ